MRPAPPATPATPAAPAAHTPAAPPARPDLALTAARSGAWALLTAGWVGTGSLALAQAPTLAAGFAWVALWLLALGGAAALATRGDLGRVARTIALGAAATLTAAALLGTVRGGGSFALALAVLGWATLTALASGVVRALRFTRPTGPAPPVAAAALGAGVAGLALGDLGDAAALAARLSALVGVLALVLALLPWSVAQRPRAGGCRAGLFDCSLPAWPGGAWRDPMQWPMLLAGLAMLPMMASLPLMAQWCRAESVPAQVAVLLHLAAMFVPALVLERWLACWSSRTLSLACGGLLVAGALFPFVAAPPYDMLGGAALHGAAWSLAWAGQLWAPARRGRQGASPWRAAAGYALLTFGFGWLVEHAGLQGIAAAHALLGIGAAVAGIVMAVAAARARGVRPRPSTR